MNLLSDFKKSRTIRLAWAKKLLGFITIISSHMSYFESSVTPAVFGTILIALGVTDNYLRQVTRKPLEDK